VDETGRASPEGTTTPLFRLLGPVQVEVGGTAGNLVSAPVCGTLAALLLAEGRFVPVRQMIQSLWDAPPKSAGSNLRLYVARLRSQLNRFDPSLGSRVLTVRGNGGGAYGLRIHRDELDLVRFRRLAARGCVELGRGSFDTAEVTFADALALWRGPVGPECRASDLLRSRFDALAELQLTVRERLTQARIGLGRSNDLVADIHEILSVAPLREASWVSLVRAHYLGGDLAGAFDAWRQAVSTLSDGLGLDPSSDLRELHRFMVHRDDPAVRELRPGHSRLGTGGVG
jgi:DNA-binding SARP family transcriptional activator